MLPTIGSADYARVTATSMRTVRLSGPAAGISERSVTITAAAQALRRKVSPISSCSIAGSSARSAFRALLR